MRLLNPRCPAKCDRFISSRTFKCQARPTHDGLHFWQDGPNYIRWDDHGNVVDQWLKL